MATSGLAMGFPPSIVEAAAQRVVKRLPVTAGHVQGQRGAPAEIVDVHVVQKQIALMAKHHRAQERFVRRARASGARPLS